ncbi:response regulator [Priestia megaterium]|uniref:response regulator n=2 Tax=Priestia TaxID=2800373 RepID=UPI003670FC18
MNYEVYCFKCSKFTGHVFETISQLPEYIECEECGRELKPLDDSIVVYKVIVDE